MCNILWLCRHLLSSGKCFSAIFALHGINIAYRQGNFGAQLPESGPANVKTRQNCSRYPTQDHELLLFQIKKANLRISQLTQGNKDTGRA